MDDLEGSLAQAREGLELFVQLQNQQGIGMAQSYEALILWFQRDFEASTRVFAELLPAMRAAEFEWGETSCRWYLGSAAWFDGDLTRAREHLNRVLETSQRYWRPDFDRVVAPPPGQHRTGC